MAYSMALALEEKNDHIIATRFLKRLFFCSKLLDDTDGSEISLNKIGVNLYKAGQYNKSLIYHQKHLLVIENRKVKDDHHRIISLYNQALCYRQMYITSNNKEKDNQLLKKSLEFLESTDMMLAKIVNDQHMKIFIKGQIALLHMMQDNLLQDLNKAEEFLK